MKKALSVLMSGVILAAVCFCMPYYTSAEDLQIYTASIEIGPDGHDIRYVDENGAEISAPSASSSPKKAKRAASSVSIPSSYDSRETGAVTSVKSQGGTGNCWVYSTTAALESDAVARGYYALDYADFSEAHLAWFALTQTPDETDPMYGDRYVINESPYEAGGNWIYSSTALSLLSGVALDSDFRSDTSEFSNMGNYPESDRVNMGSGLILKSAELLSSDQDVKSWIINHGAATVSIYYDQAYEYRSAYNCPYNADSQGNPLGTNHMVTIVGWDDDYPASNFKAAYRPSSNGAWLIKDSWGAGIHTGGYYWLSYENLLTEEFCGFSVMQRGDIFKRYSYSGFATLNMIGTGTSTTFANVYTASGGEKIDTISYFTTKSRNIIVTAKVYTGLTGDSPDSGTLACTQTASAVNEGYHTIKLTDPVPLTTGQKFSVVLTYQTTDGSQAYAPVEGLNRTDDGFYYTIKPGQSYFNLGSWVDNTDDYLAPYYLGNWNIKVYTSCSHSYESTVVAPTCVNDGYTLYTCSKCGDTMTGSIVAATGHHSFGEWSKLSESDHSNTLVSTRTCSECGETQTREFIKGSKTITLQELIRMIFERIFASFTSIKRR